MSADLTHEGTAILEAVRKQVPLLRGHSRSGEARRWVADESLAALGEAGVWSIAVPRRFGGLDLPVGDHVGILTEIGRADGSLVWVSSVYVAEAMVVQLFPEAAQAEVFEGGIGLVSGSITPTGQLTPVAGGYRLTGAWRFNTGCRGALWALVVGVVDGPAHLAVDSAEVDAPEAVLMVVPTVDLKIEDDWHVSAARATGSSTITATDIFVPQHRGLPMGDAMSGNTPGARLMRENARDYPLLAYVSAQSAATFIGLARGILELVVERSKGRAITYTPWSDQSAYPVTQIRVGEAFNMVAAAEGLVRSATEVLQRHADAGEHLSVVDNLLVHGHAAYAVDLCRQAADLLFRECGANVIRDGELIQRMHRDILGLANHGALNLTPKMEAHGRVLLGLDAGTIYV